MRKESIFGKRGISLLSLRLVSGKPYLRTEDPTFFESMKPDRANPKLWAISLLLLLATACGSLVTLSIAETFKSEESKVELTELVEVEVDAEEKIVERRDRRVRRRTITIRRSVRGQLLELTRVEVASMPPSLRSRHNGCGSHLRI